MFGNKPTPVEHPLNTEMLREYTALLAEHRTLLADHKTLIDQMRRTPHWATESPTPLFMTDDEEDARHETGIRLAPPIPNPFEDLREDEEMLRFASGLIANAEIT